jgi:DNA replication protein
MRKFKGFPPGKTRIIGLPSEFFSDLLPLIDDADELRLTLFALWAFQQKDRDEYRYLRRDDFIHPAVQPMHGLSGDRLTAALQRCVERGTLLRVELPIDETLYFANSPTGRSAVEQIKLGAWMPGDLGNPVQLLPERPSVYKLYEDNIGALTPLVIDDLKDTVAEFGAEWLTEAMQISVKMEKRNLKYVRAILERWKKEGKRSEIDERHPDGKRSIFGRYADLFEQS